MWQSTGRSGYGESTIGGDYDSWSGLSRNGRQYRNPITGETRNLSGTDYWHLRKQNRPTEDIPAHLHMYPNGAANINAYKDADSVPKKSQKRLSLRNQISLADRHFERMEALSNELDAEWKSGNIPDEEYYELRVKMDLRLDKAWLRLAKENGWTEHLSEKPSTNTPTKSIKTPVRQGKITPKNNDKVSTHPTLQPSHYRASEGENDEWKLIQEKLKNYLKSDFTRLFGSASILLVAYIVLNTYF